jgi:hypothetical protein
MLVPMAVQSKAWVCGCLPAEIVGSNPTGGMDVCLLWVLLGRGLCDELITYPEESYQLWCVVVCDLETSRMRRPWPTLGRSATAKKKKIIFLNLFKTFPNYQQQQKITRINIHWEGEIYYLFKWLPYKRCFCLHLPRIVFCLLNFLKTCIVGKEIEICKVNWF